MPIKTHTPPTKTNPKPISEWPYQRRNKLVELIIQTYPVGRYNQPDRVLARNFCDEARRWLPGLYREIERHNKRAQTVNNRDYEQRAVKQARLTSLARFGTEAQVTRLAASLLKAK